MNRAVDLVTCNVKETMVLRTGGSPFRIFVGQMKSTPNAAIGFTITEKCDLFGRDLRNSERIQQKDQLPMFLSRNERHEVSGPLRGVEIGEGAQLRIVAKLFAQELLIIAIKFSGFISLRSARANLHVCGSFYFFQSFVGKPKDQM